MLRPPSTGYFQGDSILHTYKKHMVFESCNILYKYNYYTSCFHTVELLQIFYIIQTNSFLTQKNTEQA